MRTKRAALLAVLTMILPSLAAVSASASDLSITNTTVPNPAIVGRTLTYGMNVINNGPDLVTGVVVTDNLPDGVTFVSAEFGFRDRPRAACNVSPAPPAPPTTVTCNIGTLYVGSLEGAAVFIRVQPQNLGQLSNTATLTANRVDPQSATAQTDVAPQVPDPITMDPNLAVTAVVTGLDSPTGVAFLGPNDFLVLEKGTGLVKRVVNGTVQSIVLQLPVNSFSERGLLGIALHPDFQHNHFVYLRWTCRGSIDSGDCESGPPTDAPGEVPLLGNRVDLFSWDGTTLTFEKPIIQLRAYQADAAQGFRGNHNGGKIKFGPDGKLYIYMGDNGRRGWMQNVKEGFGPDGKDDEFGGPAPDNAHLTGVILRLNEDGSTPDDNPFINVVTGSAEVDANIHKVFAYGIRNGFGFAFDPMTGMLWESQNGDDSATEINRFDAGSNGGWVQIMGLAERITDFKEIETSPKYFGLQQIRWSPTFIADTPEDALSRLFELPGSHYTDPKLTWKYEVAPAGFGFIQGQALGPDYDGNIIVGGATPLLFDGHLFRLKLSPDRTDLDLTDLGNSRFVENFDKWDIHGSEALLFGKGFGITTDILTAPNGNLYVVSLTKGAVYQIQSAAQTQTQTQTRR
jgi:uncharacterized repeat protein (TIGR01451 family)